MVEGGIAGWAVAPAGADVAVRSDEQCSVCAEAPEVGVLVGKGLDV